ncbi:MAG: RNA polymerase sigma factor [Solobacterium sp.]|nr:RNA polymerase sigma factor [Solobacterium sp.]
MEDREIVQLYWDRDEAAIKESSLKYGVYCRSISRNILESWEDAEEVVNDTWLKAWNAIPPKKPSILSVFLGRITRNLSFDIYRREHREKRGGHQIDLVLDELAECVSGKSDPQREFEASQLTEDLNRFLASLPEDKRNMFILRYWYAESIASIAERFNVSENNISVTLNRIRKKLKNDLVERGYDI